MEEQGKNMIPDRYKILSGSALKCIALVTMIIDHIQGHLLSNLDIVLMRLGEITVTLNSLLHKIGRIAFPIYCFLLVEGFLHTHEAENTGRICCSLR